MESDKAAGLMEADSAEEPAPAAAAGGMELEPDADAGDAPEDGEAEKSVTLANGVHQRGENGVEKRGRGEGEGEDEAEGVKRQKVERSVEEERLESMEKKATVEAGEEGKEGEKDGDDGDGKVKGGPVKLGPKSFDSSVEMFDYFYKLLHSWSPNLDINKYENMALMDLIKKGHPEPDKKIGGGIQSFQVRYHPLWKSRCFFLLRVDGSSDDFSFRKCVDRILSLPDNMKAPGGNKSGGNQRGGGRGRGSGSHGRRGGRGGGQGGRGKRGRK